MKPFPQREIAELLSVTTRTVREWAAFGLPRHADGTYPAPECVQWLLRRETAEGLDLDHERARLAAAQAEKVERENAVRRGELADMRDVERFWTDCIANARARLLRLPTECAGMLPHDQRAVVAAAVQRGVCEALTELAAYAPAER